MDSAFHLEMKLDRCTGESYVNGIPVARRSAPEVPFCSVPVNQFLAHGGSLVELIINPGSTPSVSRTERTHVTAAGSAASVQIVRYPFGGDEDDGVVLTRASWVGEEGRDEFPVRIACEVQITEPAGPWVWQWSDELRSPTLFWEVDALVRSIHQSFAAGDPEPIVALCGYRFADGARAYPRRSAERFAAGLREGLARRSAAYDWAVEPLNPDEFDFRLCANNRLIEVINRDWLPTIRSCQPEVGVPYRLPMFLGSVKGRLQILR